MVGCDEIVVLSSITKSGLLASFPIFGKRSLVTLLISTTEEFGKVCVDYNFLSCDSIWSGVVPPDSSGNWLSSSFRRLAGVMSRYSIWEAFITMASSLELLVFDGD